MIRDYKYSAGRHEPPVQVVGKVRGFLSGLFLGLVFAGAVHVYHVIQKPEVEDFNPPESGPISAEPAEAESKPGIGSELHKALVKEAGIEVPKSSIQHLLQAGSYRTQEEAEARHKRILALGYKSQIREITTDDEVLYLVELGPYQQFEAAQAALGVLKRNRIEVMLKQYSQ